MKQRRKGLSRTMFCEHCATQQVAYPRKYTCKQCGLENTMVDYLPTPEEIAKKCEAIRSRWSPGELRARNAYRQRRTVMTARFVAPNDKEWFEQCVHHHR
jgi:hypothetical protein